MIRAGLEVSFGFNAAAATGTSGRARATLAAVPGSQRRGEGGGGAVVGPHEAGDDPGRGTSRPVAISEVIDAL